MPRLTTSEMDLLKDQVRSLNDEIGRLQSQKSMLISVLDDEIDLMTLERNRSASPHVRAHFDRRLDRLKACLELMKT